MLHAEKNLLIIYAYAIFFLKSIFSCVFSRVRHSSNGQEVTELDRM